MGVKLHCYYYYYFLSLLSLPSLSGDAFNTLAGLTRCNVYCLNIITIIIIIILPHVLFVYYDNVIHVVFGLVTRLLFREYMYSTFSKSMTFK